MSSRVEPESLHKDFNWSLSPIFNLLAFIGIDLRDPDSSCLKWVAVLVNVGIQISYYAAALYNPNIQPTFVEEKVSTKIFSFTTDIDLVNTSMQTIAVYLLLLFDIGKKWKYLWRLLEDMKHRFHPNFNVKLRRRSIIGTIYIVFSVNMKTTYSDFITIKEN